MSIFATSDRLITIFYNSTIILDKVLALAKAENIAIWTVDVLRNPLTGVQLEDLANRLGVPARKLIDEESDLYRKKLKNEDFKEEDWLKIIEHNPEALKLPIAIRGERIVLIHTPTDILRLFEK
jgi:arsenate reductase (glutaredoxin)